MRNWEGIDRGIWQSGEGGSAICALARVAGACHIAIAAVNVMNVHIGRDCKKGCDIQVHAGLIKKGGKLNPCCTYVKSFVAEEEEEKSSSESSRLHNLTYLALGPQSGPQWPFRLVGLV